MPSDTAIITVEAFYRNFTITYCLHSKYILLLVYIEEKLLTVHNRHLTGFVTGMNIYFVLITCLT